MGVFNCQGAGWCRVGKTNLVHDEKPGTITGSVRAKDVDYLVELLATDEQAITYFILMLLFTAHVFRSHS
jgi:hypothetical protein